MVCFFLCEVFYLLNGKFIVGFFFCKVVLRGCYEVFEGGVCLKLFGFGLDIVRGLYFFVGWKGCILNIGIYKEEFFCSLYFLGWNTYWKLMIYILLERKLCFGS